jgi:conjugative relaxase-like TrwC/TraI family protein
VMTLHKLTAGDGYLYLTRQVAGGDVPRERGQDATGYYTAQGNPPGAWMGSGCEVLGLSGEVSEPQMQALFGVGQHPDAERIIRDYLHDHVRPGMTEAELDSVLAQARKAAQLGRPFPAYRRLEPFEDRVIMRLAVISQETGRAATEAEVRRVQREEARRSRHAVAGFDLVFTPVKSVSVLWGLDTRDWVRSEIEAAHRMARDSAIELLEEHAAFTRTGSSGQAQIETHGLTAAVFDHADSRCGDPDLHSHVAVSTKVLGVDGVWRALDARALYRIGVAASEHYNTVLEAEVVRRLGVEFAPRADTEGSREPVREIAGIDPRILEHYSNRRSAITARYRELVREYWAAHGREPSLPVAQKLAQQATLETRDGKKPLRPWADLFDHWRADLTEHFGPEALTELVNAVPERDQLTSPMPADLDVPKIAARVLDGLQEQRSTWTRWNALAETERALRGQRFSDKDAHDEAVTAIVGHVLTELCLSIEAPALLDEPQGLRRSDGASVFDEHATGRYTSRAILDAEQRLLVAAKTPVDVPPRPLIPIQGLRELDPGQRALAIAFATEPRLLSVGIGPAGSGKTTAMRALATILDSQNRRLIPLATSATAASVLAAELDRPAENVHKFLHARRTGQAANSLFALGPGDVVLVDEAGMAGTLNLDALVKMAAENGATVRLLGDPRQLGAVESGGALRLLAAESDPVELTALYRFRDADEAAATARIRVGDTAGLDFYELHDRVRHGSAENMAEAAYQGWKADMLAGKTTLMAAAANAKVSELSARARADRVAAGQVEADGARLHDGNVAGRGDWIVTRANRRRLTTRGGRDFVKNGDAWHVACRYDDGSLRARHLGHGGAVILPAAYVAEHVELLYATTAHRAQGSTVDTAHPLITPELGRETLYVLLSRARERTTLYVATHDGPSLELEHHVDRARFDPSAYLAREILENVLAAENSEPSATEAIRTALADSRSLATLMPRHRHALDQATRRHYEGLVRTILPAHADGILNDAAWPPLARRLREADQLGQPAGPLLRRTANRRELNSAASIAQVLCWRFDAILDVVREQQPHPQVGSGPTAWQRQIPRGIVDEEWIGYLEQSEALVRSRITELAEAAIAQRPAWLGALGLEPEKPQQAGEWRRAVEAAVAFREEYGVETDDAAHPLGTHLEGNRAGHSAQRFVERLISVARRSSEIETETSPQPQPESKPSGRDRRTRRHDGANEPRRSTQLPVQEQRRRGGPSAVPPGRPTIRP